MTPDQREILLIPVPFTDLSSQKRRPVLVLSSLAHNSTLPDIVVAAITSNLATPGGGVAIDTADLEHGTMPTRSLVRPDKVYTLSKTIIVKSYGRLANGKFAEVLVGLAGVLDLDAIRATFGDDTGRANP